MHIGENIRRLRMSRGESQQELAQVCGVTDKAVSTWECGRKTPRMAVLLKLARHYGIKTSELIDGEIPMPPIAISHGIAVHQARARLAAAGQSDQPGEPGEPGQSGLLDPPDQPGQPIGEPLHPASKLASEWLSEPPAPPPRYEDDETDQGLFKNPKPRPADDLRALIDAFRDARPETQNDIRRLLNLDAARAARPRKVEMIVYDDPAAAGLPLYAESDYERISFPASAVPAGADFGIRILGDSMAPAIADGDIVWVRKQDELRDGEIGIFMIGDSAVCKRLSYPGGALPLRLLSDNPAFGPIQGAQLADMRVVGKVLR